jgi:glucosamine-6-phosphate deaminase
MRLRVFPDRATVAEAAAAHAAGILRSALRDRGGARIVAATAASQREFLETLTAAPGIDWINVEAFHLDEYIGLPAAHRGSFRRMLREQLIEKTGIAKVHWLDGEADPSKVLHDVGQALASAPVDVAFVGVGENGHLAFNDPPADFETDEPYLVVALDEACRRQQVGEGWFASLSEVPTHALSMSVRQILKAREIVAVVPGSRKAAAVQACFEGRIGPMAPASILRTHANATVYLDADAAALLSAGLVDRG